VKTGFLYFDDTMSQMKKFRGNYAAVRENKGNTAAYTISITTPDMQWLQLRTINFRICSKFRDFVPVKEDRI
jgi:hypothetical protein